jgi:hypothetical protein
MGNIVKVLNTVTAGGGDFAVSSNGVVSLSGSGNFRASARKSVVITPAVAEQLGVITVTPTSANSAEFTIFVYGFDTVTKQPKTAILSIISPSSSNATAICDAWRTALEGVSDFSVAGSGTATLVLTAKAGLPFFEVGGDAATMSSIGSGSGVSLSNTVTISGTNGTLTIVSAGTVALLQAKYPVNQYPEIANLTAGQTYTEVDITYLGSPNGSSGEYTNTVGTSKLVGLIKTSVENADDLIGVYGTITAFKAGFKATIGARTTGNGKVTITTGTGAISLSASSGDTLFSGSDLRAGDYILAGAAYTTPEVPTRIKVTTSNTAGIGTYAETVAAVVYRPVTWRKLTY